MASNSTAITCEFEKQANILFPHFEKQTTIHEVLLNNVSKHNKRQSTIHYKINQFS
jgi:hypothetical protein